MVVEAVPELDEPTAVTTRPSAGAAPQPLSPAKAVARGALALLSAQPLTWAASILSLVLVPRFLGDVAYGQAVLALSLVALVQMMGTLGLLDYLTRSLSGRGKSELHTASQAFVLMMIGATVTAVLLVVGVHITGLQVGGEIVLGTVVCLVILTPVQGLLNAVLRGHERVGMLAAINSIGAAVASLVSTLVLVLGGGLVGYMVSMLLVIVINDAVGWWVSGVRLPRPDLSLAPLLSLLRLGLPFLGWSTMMQFYGQISTILLAALASGDVVGWYGAANRIIAVPAFAPTLLVVPLLPALTRCKGDRAVFRRTLNASLRATVLFTFPFCAAIIAAAPAIPQFMGWPAEFDAAAIPMTIQAPHLTLVALDMVLGTALIALGMERKWLVAGIVACVVGATLNWIGIPYTQTTWGNGSIGAAVATIASESVMLLGALLLMPRGILDHSGVSLTVRMLVAAVPFVAVTRFGLGLDMPLLLAGPLGAVVFLLAALALRVVTMADIRVALQYVTNTMNSKFGGPGRLPIRGLAWLKR